MFVLLLALQQSVADSSPFRPLALPPATPVRSASGAPGPRYWQQRADYSLEATLDTAANVLRGTGRIYYVNRSPETLDYVWVQLDQNIFAPNSISRALNQPPLRFAGGVVFDFSAKGFVGGITVDRFAAAGRPLTTKVFGTMMRVELPRPLAPNLSITFDIAWHFPIPPYGGGRMRRVGSRFYELCQWYPRMAVYDDVHGWNTLPFLGAGEFYLEFGDFDVSLTVPLAVNRHVLVPGTGRARSPTRDKPCRSSHARKRRRTRRDPCPAPRRGDSRPAASVTSRGRPVRACAGMPAHGTGYWCRRSIIRMLRRGKSPTLWSAPRLDTSPARSAGIRGRKFPRSRDSWRAWSTPWSFTAPRSKSARTSTGCSCTSWVISGFPCRWVRTNAAIRGWMRASTRSPTTMRPKRFLKARRTPTPCGVSSWPPTPRPQLRAASSR